MLRQVVFNPKDWLKLSLGQLTNQNRDKDGEENGFS